MLVRAYRTYQPALLLGLLLLAPAVWSGPFVQGVPLPQGPYMPAYRPLAQAFALWPWAAPLAGALVTAALALQLDRLANDRELFERHHHLPALLLPLLLATGPLRMAPDPAMLGMPAVLHALRLVWGTQGRHQVLGALFDAGCLVGVAALLYFPYVFLVVVLWASVAVMRPYAWRDYAVPLLGMVLVLVMAWGVVALTVGPGAWAPLSTLSLRTADPAPTHWLRDRLAPSTVVVLWALAVPSMAGVYRRSIMREKNVRASFLAFAFTCLLLLGFAALLGHPPSAVLVACPLAVVLSYPLQAARHLWPAELAVAVLLVAAVAGPWWG
ncbi:MAG: hypothetical protein IT228_04245 [Flavobacteriales bacterium]|nr:hypothetical protein [Flavobacteriales bacterium]MCC6576534.1 hypothetical protein [Flavobacteriales bacterium]NUQ14302.1 hypothetical protein [Flavobacteriales bacterium]